MLLEKIVTAYEEKVPLSLALPSDDNGLKLGSLNQKVTKVLGCLELTPEVAKYVVAEQADCLFVHHDPFYFPLHNLRGDDAHTRTILELVKHDIALYVSHTNLDIVQGGLNDYIFTLLGGKDAKILEESTGLGRYGELIQPLTLSDYIKTFVEPVQQKFRVITNDLQTKIHKIAVVNGSGANYLKEARTTGVDLFITGDVDYHTAMLARIYNVAMLDIGHDVEYLVHDVFTRILKEIKKETNEDFSVIETTVFDFSPW